MKKLLSLVLCLVIMVSMMPVSAFAEETDTPATLETTSADEFVLEEIPEEKALPSEDAAETDLEIQEEDPETEISQEEPLLEVQGTVSVETTVAVTEVSLDISSAELKIGETLQLTAAIFPDNATDKTITWSSSDDEIALVDEAGLITAVSAGTADITVTTSEGGFSAVCKITVAEEDEKAVTGIGAEITKQASKTADSEEENKDEEHILIYGKGSVTDPETEVEINETNFPDASFRSYISSNFDTDKNIYLSNEEILNVTRIEFYTEEISDLTGIGFFTALNYLDCESNSLTSLDISNNKMLTYLDCSYNQLKRLDISKNTALEKVNCSRNNLTGLYLGTDTVLSWLNCSNNKLEYLDVSDSTALTYLSVGHNLLTELYVNNNTALSSLNCEYNQLRRLNLNNNTALTSLDCQHNELIDLDISSNTALNTLKCNDNELGRLDLSNNTALISLNCGYNEIKYLDVSKNTAITNLNCEYDELTSIDLSNNTALTRLYSDNNSYSLKVDSFNQFDLSSLVGFDVSKASNWTGGTVEGNILTFASDTVTYTYDVGNSSITNPIFTLTTTLSNVPATGVSLNKTRAVIGIGETLQLTATVSPVNASNQSVVWTSSDETVATVDENGLVTAIGAGTANITVTTEDGEYTATCEVTSVLSGSWGSLTWTLDDEGLLTISGIGAMNDFSDSSNDAWLAYSSDIKSVIIEDGITYITDYAFRDLSNLTSVSIPDSVTSIGDWAFAGCSSLTSVTIPYSVTSIGGYAFDGCSGLISINIPGSIEEIPYYSFNGCSSLTDVVIQSGVKTIGSCAFRGCLNLNNLTIPATVDTVRVEAFYNCTKLENVYIENTDAWFNIDFQYDLVVESGTYTYYQTNPMCFANSIYLNGQPITEVTIPEGVTDLRYRLKNWKELETVIIPNSVTDIGDYAFAGCTALTSVFIPEGVTSIGDYAFGSCRTLTSVVIPDNVNSIGYCAFCYCDNLDNLIIGNSVLSIGDASFTFCKNLKSVTIPGSVNSIGNYAFQDCGLTSVIIENGLSGIGNNVFSNCKSLETIVIPESVVSIGEGALRNCKVTDIYYEGSVNSWNAIEISSVDNSSIDSARIHYNVTDPESHWIAVATEPTCTEQGYTTFSCLCNDDYSYKDIYSDALGHDWNDPVFTFSEDGKSATATRTCKRDASHTETANATVTSEITKQATCTEKGETSYTAKVVFNGAEYTEAKVIADIKALGHKYVHTVTEPTSTSQGYTTHTCERCGHSYKDNYTLVAPEAPTLSAVNSGTGIRISWKAVNGATNYSVYRRTSETGTWVSIGHTTATSIINTKVTPGTTYYYMVRCLNEEGTKTISSIGESSCINYLAAVSAPALSAINNGIGIKVSWKAVDGATNYSIYRRTSETGSWVSVGHTTATSLINKIVTPGTTYYYMIRCLDSTGKLLVSPVGASAEITYLKAPDAPSLSAVNSGIGIKVSWKAVDGATSYSIYRRTSETGSWVSVGHSTSTSLVNRKVTPGTTYYYMVRCLDDSGKNLVSPAGTSAEISYLSAQGAPTLSIVSNGVKITWKAVDGVTNYSVYSRTSETGSWVSVGHTSSTSLVNRKVTAGTTYYYMVRCLDSTGKILVSPEGNSSSIVYTK